MEHKKRGGGIQGEDNPEIVTDTTVLPGLVDPVIFGHHSSEVRPGKPNMRVWKFESGIMAKKFVMMCNAGKFRRTTSTNAKGK